MQSFIYNTPTKVYFGKGKEKEIGLIIKDLGYKNVMIQYGKGSVKKSGLLDLVISELKKFDINYVEFGGVEPNPKLEFVREAVKVCKEKDIDFILAIGGGSVLDSSKFTAIGSKTDIDVWEFPVGNAVVKDALPVGCILTIAAAGSEMSNSAVLSNLSESKKKGCSTEFNRCKFAIMNPELTYTVSRYQTACGIVDIMAHTMERYFTDYEDTLLTDRIAESILKTVVESGKVLMSDPTNYEARANVMWASSLSHNGLTGCGRENYLAVHQLEHAVSGEYDHVAHGAGLAVLFPAWAKYVYKSKPSRFARFAREVFGVDEKDDLIASELGIKKMSDYFKLLDMPSRLSDFNIPFDALDKLTLLCTNNNTRTIKSYIPLGYKEVKDIFELAF